MNGQKVGACRGVPVDPGIRVGQHQVDVQYSCGPAAQSGDEIQPKQQVWDADSIHNIHVVPVYSRVDEIDGLSKS
jgi:hypothetical protein